MLGHVRLETNTRIKCLMSPSLSLQTDLS